MPFDPLDGLFPNDDDKMSEAIEREFLGEDDFGCGDEPGWQNFYEEVLEED